MLLAYTAKPRVTLSKKNTITSPISNRLDKLVANRTLWNTRKRMAL